MKKSVLALACAAALVLGAAGCAAEPQSTSSAQHETSAIQIESDDAVGVWEMMKLEMGGSVIRGEDEYKKNQGSSKNSFLVIDEDGTYTQYDKGNVTTGTWSPGASGSLSFESARGEKIAVTTKEDTLTWFDDANDITMTFCRAAALPKGLTEG